MTAVALAVATVMTTGLVVIPDPVQGSDTSTDTDNPCAGNAITQPSSTEDSEEVDSDTECEFYGSGDIEGGGGLTQARKMWMETVLVMLVITVLRPLIQIRVTLMKTVWVMTVMVKRVMWTLVIHKRTNPNLTRFFLVSAG